MNFKANFVNLKGAVVTIGKAVKKNASPLETPLIKIKASADGAVELSTNGNIGCCVEIPAEVSEAGEFVTTFSSINLLSIRKCDGDVVASNEANENVLVLKYRGGKAKTALNAVSSIFNPVASVPEECAEVSLPYTSLKNMCKETAFAADDNVTYKLHAVKMNIEDDVDGLIKFTLTACDGKSIAVRTAYAVKEGGYTGEVLVLPDILKTSLDILDTDEENVMLSFGDGKLFMQAGNVRTCFAVLDKDYPDLSRIINSKNDKTFTVKVNRDELIEALNCASYLHNEQKSSDGVEGSVSLKFEKDSIAVGFTGVTQYAENLDAETEGEIPDATVYFKTSLIKEIIALYPNETVIIGGTTSKNPFWMCCGEHDEYVYCVMPRIQKNNEK